MSEKQRTRSILITALLVALNLVALNGLISGWSTARVDLTEERLFSISPATERMLTTLDEELTVHAFFSKRTHPKLAPLIPELLDLLEEYAAVSAGRVRIVVADPGDDEATEQEAAERFGVRSVPFRLASKYESGIVNAYFAVVVQFGDQYERYGFEDLIRVDPLPDGDFDVRLRNPEYDLTRAMKKVVYGFRGAGELFDRLEQPAKLTAVITPGQLPELFAEVPQALRTAAEELRQAGGEKFVYEEIDPTGDESLQRDLYTRYGVRPISLSILSEQSFFLYAILDINGRQEQLLLAQDSLTAAEIRETIESTLRRHTPGFLKTVGVVAPAPISLPPELQMQYRMPTPPPEFEEVQRLLRQDYRVEPVTLDDDAGVPADVDVLLVIKPSELSKPAVFQLDQYLMRGGRVVLFAGRYDVDFDASGLRVAPLTTGLEDWLKHFGVTLEPTLVLDDRNQPLPIPEVRQTPLGPMRSWTMAPYPYLVQVTEDGLLDRRVTGSLEGLGVYWASPLSVDREAAGELEVLPLLQSSARSWTDDDASRVAYVDYSVPAEGTEPQLLALALNGRFDSFFAGRASDGEQAGDVADTDGIPPEAVVLERSPQTRLLIVGNAELLSDTVAQTIGGMNGGFFLENLRFAENAIDWIGLDNDMIEIRSRGGVLRRLNKVDRGHEVVIEAVNYAIPVVLLGALALYMFQRRRSVEPAYGDEARPLPNRPACGEA